MEVPNFACLCKY